METNTPFLNMPPYVWKGIFEVVKILLAGIVLGTFASKYQKRKEVEMQVKGKILKARIDSLEKIDNIMIEKEIIESINFEELSQKYHVTFDDETPRDYGNIKLNKVVKNAIGEVVAVMEVKLNFDQHNVDSAMNVIFKCFATDINLYYGIITNSNNFCLVVERRGERAAALLPAKTLEEALSYIAEMHKKIAAIAEEQRDDAISKTVTSLKAKFKGLSKCLDEFLKELNKDRLTMKDNIVSLLPQDETAFFSNLLWKDKERVTTLAKYCTKETLFRMLNDMKQTMASLVNMNDKSECDYADKLLDNDESKWFEKDKEEVTNCFLMSMVDGNRKDELTPWRLYGDQSRGVSISYDNCKNENNGFYVATVHYVKTDEEEKILPAIKEMQYKELNNGIYFLFGNWSVWKHFFKSADYEVKKEYRIIYQRDYENKRIPPLKWVSDPSTNIFFPIAEFYLRQEDLDVDSDKDHNMLFPFPIKEVFLGPNMPEADANKAEIELMAQDKLNLSWNIKNRQYQVIGRKI